MRYHRVYRLVDPRYLLEDPKHIRYVGRTSKKLSKQLCQHLTNWPREGSFRRAWLRDMSQAGVEPNIVAIERVKSAREAKERKQYWVHYYEGQGYELINAQLDERLPAWDRQRVVEDFQIEVMRLLLGQEPPYSVALGNLSGNGEGSALQLYLQAAETPDLSIEEIPDLFQERDERVRGLECKVLRAIDSGEIQGSIVSALREAIEEGKRSVVEEGSAIEHYVAMVAAAAAKDAQSTSR